mmetsp:Transcript_9879/g.21335  ORF Transcript_9879/g.21335 Transcript_9879/m.21335 type:complete len:680 (+) Transcript_9879:261-2300(+)
MMDYAMAKEAVCNVIPGGDEIDARDVIQYLLMRGKLRTKDLAEATSTDARNEFRRMKAEAERHQASGETEEVVADDGVAMEPPAMNKSRSLEPANDSCSASQSDIIPLPVSSQLPQHQPQQQPQEQQPQNRYRHVALLFHYDGASYSGFAQNLPPSSSTSTSANTTSASATNDNSIERSLFAALTKSCLISSRKEANYSRAGRTDRGVSAWGQVVALNLRSAVPLGARLPGDGGEQYGREVTEADLPGGDDVPLDCWAPVRMKKKKNNKSKRGKEKSDPQSVINNNDDTSQPKPLLKRRQITELSYTRILNNILPPTIRILGWCPVTPSFSARFSCSDRTYRYHFIRRNLNLSAMDEALQKMVGRHDFRNLCKMNVEQVCNFERVIKSAKIVVATDAKRGSIDDAVSANGDDGNHQYHYHDTCHFEIIGQAFLWHQIRCIVSVLFMVGKGLESPDIVDHLLDVQTNPGKPSYPMADELPLVLHRCSYGGTDGGDRVPFRRSVRDLWRVACDLEKRWEEMTLAAARLRDGLDSLLIEATVTRGDLETYVREILEERRKKSRRTSHGNLLLTDRRDESTAGARDPSSVLPWGDALREIELRLGVRPTPEGQKEPLHIPLLQRSRGTTYEEKVASLNAASKDDSEETKKRRRERYEENIVRKRKTTEEDQAFYDHMLSQGGR